MSRHLIDYTAVGESYVRNALAMSNMESSWPTSTGTANLKHHQTIRTR